MPIFPKLEAINFVTLWIYQYLVKVKIFSKAIYHIYTAIKITIFEL